MAQNLVPNHLPADHWTQIDASIGQLSALLAPLLTPVAASTKKVMVKMGPGSEVFCREAVHVFQENIELMPRSFDLDEMRRDLESHDALNARIVTLTRLLERARDTEMALGSDAMSAALEGYGVLKAMSKGEGVRALKKMLSRRFEVPGRSLPPVATPMPTPQPTPPAPGSAH